MEDKPKLIIIGHVDSASISMQSEIQRTIASNQEKGAEIISLDEFKERKRGITINEPEPFLITNPYIEFPNVDTIFTETNHPTPKKALNGRQKAKRRKW